MEMKLLYPKYSAEVDKIGKTEWSRILQRFEDANIYQSWSYGAVRWGERNLSHIVLKKNGEIVAAAQLRIIKFPLLSRGIAYLRWGPMWRLSSKKVDLENMRQMSKALKREYVIRKGLFLRALPNEFDCSEEANEVRATFESEGFRLRWNSVSYRTFLLDLRPPLEELRRNLKKKWRNRLKRAERNEFEIFEGCSDELFEALERIYLEMVSRKKFATFVSVEEFRQIQKDLPRPLKMTVILCKHCSEIVSGVVFSAMGHTGLCLLSANNTKARELQSAYLLKWKTIEWMKERGCTCIDLGGRDPIRSPEVDHFKAGISGRDVCKLGSFEAWGSPLSYILVIMGDLISAVSRRTKIILAKKTVPESFRQQSSYKRPKRVISGPRGKWLFAKK